MYYFFKKKINIRSIHQTITNSISINNIHIPLSSRTGRNNGSLNFNGLGSNDLFMSVRRQITFHQIHYKFTIYNIFCSFITLA